MCLIPGLTVGGHPVINDGHLQLPLLLCPKYPVVPRQHLFVVCKNYYEKNGDNEKIKEVFIYR